MTGRAHRVIESRERPLIATTATTVELGGGGTVGGATTTTALATVRAVPGPVVRGPAVEAAAATFTTTPTLATLARLTGLAAVLAAAGLVLKPLLSEELLLASSEREALAAVTAGELDILKVGHVDRAELQEGGGGGSWTTMERE